MYPFSPHSTVINYNADNKQDRLLLGIGLMVLGESLIVISGVAIKIVTQELPVTQVVFFRNFFGLLFLIPMILQLGLGHLKTEHIGIHLLRGIFGLCAMIGLFYSFETLTLSEAVLLKATSPIILSVMAFLILGERLNRLACLALVMAFIGVVIVANPTVFDPVIGLGFIAGSLSALFAALAKTMVRILGRTEKSSIIVFYFTVFASALSLPSLVFFWQMPTVPQWGYLFLIALLSTTGQIAITKAFSVAKAGRVGLFTYLSLPIAGFLGWLIWSETFSTELIIGANIIVMAGVICLLSEQKNTK